MTAIKCNRYMCGVRLVEKPDAFGGLTFVCPACARNKRGLCRDCPAPLTAKHALRCPGCAKRHLRNGQAASNRRRYRTADGRRRMLANNRRSRRNPAVLERNKKTQKAYREDHPVERDAATRLYFREWARNRRADPRKNAHDLKQRRGRYAERKSA
jgi:hypothetical protein